MLGSFVLDRTFGILWLTFFIIVVVLDIIFRLHAFHSTQCVLAYRNLCLQANLYSFVFFLDRQFFDPRLYTTICVKITSLDIVSLVKVSNRKIWCECIRGPRL